MGDYDHLIVGDYDHLIVGDYDHLIVGDYDHLIVGDYDHLIVVELVEWHHVKAVAVPAGLCHQGHSLPKEKSTPTLGQRQNTEISKQIFPEKEYRGLSPYFHIHASLSDLYIPTIGLPIVLLPNWQTNPGNV